MNKKIEINIEELVLHGFAPGDRKKIGEAIELALIQAFNQQNMSGMLNKSANIPFADAGSFNMQKNSKPAHVGNAIGNSISSSLINIK